LADNADVNQFVRDSCFSQGLKRKDHSPAAMHDRPPTVFQESVTKSRREGKAKVRRSLESADTNGMAVERTHHGAKMRYQDRPGSTVLWQAYKLPQIASGTGPPFAPSRLRLPHLSRFSKSAHSLGRWLWELLSPSRVPADRGTTNPCLPRDILPTPRNAVMILFPPVCSG
jgi:hypothetical protein